MMRWLRRISSVFVLNYLVGILLFPHYSCAEGNPDDYQGGAVSAWNELVLKMAVAEDKLLTLKGVRTAAMLHIAMHDALNNIHSVYNPYVLNSTTKAGDPLAAVSQAGYEIAVSQFPNQELMLRKELDRWLKIAGSGNLVDRGIYLGKLSATAVLEIRANDKWNAEAEYAWHPMGPGIYAEFNEHSGTPEGFVFGAGWAKAVPFMLQNQDQFRAPPPPLINSRTYTEAFNEVKDVGHFQSESRTPDQTHLAMWWKDFVENSHNRLARRLINKEQLNLWEAARLFALLNMAIYDAYVNVFENKFYYNHWRPYTAIRRAAYDGNPDTEPDLDWNNLHRHTYAFPSYPSAHGAASAAAMTVLADVLGDEYTFTMVIREVDKGGPFSEKIKTDPPFRSFGSFSEAAMECAMSRLYLGIHFRYDSIEGYHLGSKVGKYACDNYLVPVDKR